MRRLIYMGFLIMASLFNYDHGQYRILHRKNIKNTNMREVTF